MIEEKTTEISTEKIIEISTKVSTEIILEELKKRNLIHEYKNSFQLAEQFLYIYPKIKEAVQDNEEDINSLIVNGLPQSSGALKTIVSGNTRLDKDEIIENKIIGINNANTINKVYIAKIDRILERYKDHKYIDIIRLKYFQGKSRQEIADILDCDEKTVTTNKNKLINEIKILLFPNNCINELGY